jgi:hypothetical protein
MSRGFESVCRHDLVMSGRDGREYTGLYANGHGDGMGERVTNSTGQRAPLIQPDVVTTANSLLVCWDIRATVRDGGDGGDEDGIEAPICRHGRGSPQNCLSFHCGRYESRRGARSPEMLITEGQETEQPSERKRQEA